MFEKLKAGVKNLADKVKQTANDMKLQNAENETLKTAQDQFNDAFNLFSDNLKLMDERESLYLGTANVDTNINNKNTKIKKKLANNVRNIVKEFTETQVDNTIPQPLITEKTEEDISLAQIIEKSLKSDLSEINIERKSDKQERTCLIQGYSLFEVFWDKSKSTHISIGNIGIKLIHPKQFIPQPGVWNIQEMDYFFIMASVTKRYVKKRYNVDVKDEDEQYPGVDSIDGGSQTTPQSSKITELVKWYKDDDGEIGRYVWCNDTVLEDIPKFFKRKLDGKDIETFKLTDDYGIKSITTDLNGIVTTIPKIKAGTELPYFTPDRYPVVLRVNVPFSADVSFGGQSDTDDVRDQQDLIKKLISRAEEKALSIGAIIGIPQSVGGRYKPTNDVVQIVELKPNEVGQFQSISLTPQYKDDLEFADQQYSVAAKSLGITPALQGQPDPSARSGFAKQLQIAQSTGHLKSKQLNKTQTYKELYEIIFQFKLAFMDEPRPYVTKGIDGKSIYSQFNRLNFLKQDSAGVWYYNTDFTFAADANGGLPSDRTWILNETTQLFQYGAFGQLADPQTLIRLWTNLANIHYPGAEEIKASIEKAATSPIIPPPNNSTPPNIQSLLQGGQK